MAVGQIVGGELRRHPAPADREAGAEHRQLRAGVSDRAHDVGSEASQSQADQHERDRQLLGGVGGAERRREQRCADDTDHDRAHRHVLVASGVLAEHPLGKEQQHEQTSCERGLNDGEWREQQRDHLQRPAEERQPGAEQPTRSSDETPRERQTQVLLVRRLLGVRRLQRDP